MLCMGKCRMIRRDGRLLSGFVLLACSCLVALLLPGCASLPPRPDLGLEEALPPAGHGPLAELTDRFLSQNGPQVSGFRLLIDSKEAYDSRLALADMATSSIDLQYFIWKGDAAGTVLFDRLLQAADRGVRVRIIVDDLGIASSTAKLTALNTHPNLEIRIFNPNPSRDYLIAGIVHFLASFQELNRRMHNKLMIVDNHVLIAGGRNIGNEYFGVGNKFNFIDVDVLSIGAIIEETSDAFDDYWNNNAVYPVSGWRVNLPENTFEEMRREFRGTVADAEAELGSSLLRDFDDRSWLKDVENSLSTGSAHFLQDAPVQIDGRDYRLVDMIAYFSEPTKSELLFSSPYLIPAGDALDNLRREVEKGVEVGILTNSLASTNHTIVDRKSVV